MFQEISQWIDKREEPGNLDRAITELKDLKKAHPDNDLICGKLAHAYAYKGFFAFNNVREQSEYYEKGTAYGKQALDLNPKAIYGNFWYGTNVGLLGLSRGIMSSLKSVRPLANSMERVLAANENFYFGGPHRVLGRLFHQVPGWPVSIGNKSKAAEHLERAVSIGPQFFVNRLFLAEFYLDTGKKAHAKPHLEFLLETPLNPDHKVEDGVHKDQAQTLFEKYF